MQQQEPTLTDHLSRLWREGREGGRELYHRRYYADGIAWASGTGRLSQRAEHYVEGLSYDELLALVEGWHKEVIEHPNGEVSGFTQNDVPKRLNNFEEHLGERLEVALTGYASLLQEHEFIGMEMDAFKAPSELAADAYGPTEEALLAQEAKIRGLHDHIERYTGEHPDPHFFCPGCEACADYGEEPA